MSDSQLKHFAVWMKFQKLFFLDLSSYFHSFFSPFFSSFIFLSEFPRHATPTPAAEIYVTRHNLQNFSLFFGMWFHFNDPHDNCRRLFHLLPPDNQVTPGPVWRPSERWTLLMSESLYVEAKHPAADCKCQKVKKYDTTQHKPTGIIEAVFQLAASVCVCVCVGKKRIRVSYVELWLSFDDCEFCCFVFFAFDSFVSVISSLSILRRLPSGCLLQ